ncbi:MAG: ATP-binding cassette domain-containing protein [Paracoccus sp. (in: a-proteobacteria)]
MFKKVLLETRDLSVAFGDKLALDRVNIALAENEVVGIVGETGAGKSLLARSLIGLLPPGAERTNGDVWSDGRALSTMSPAELRNLRGGVVSLIGTNAKALLDPVQPVGEQVATVLRSHKRLSHRVARQAAVKLFRQVGITDPESRATAYPHQLSGGMAQRIVIAMALVAGPKVVLADDATLGLDATIQVQVLDLLVERCRTEGLGTLIITHDLGIVSQYCDRVAIMKGGQIVEQNDVSAFLAGPQTSYGQELLKAAKVRPTLIKGDGETSPKVGDGTRTEPKSGPLLQIRDMVKHFRGRDGGVVKAVDEISIEIGRGETLALVGESGSGKTTAGQCIVRLLDIDRGEIVFDGKEIGNLPASEFRAMRKRIQMVFQEPYVALNPRWRVEDLISEPLSLDETVRSAADRRSRVLEMLEAVRLPKTLAKVFPHELTAGEQKRVGMARALATRPDFVVFDEPTTALDIRVRAQIIDLIRTLQREMGLSALFITHDLNSVRSLAHRVAVMRYGKIVETGDTSTIFERPGHDYTRMLLDAELPIERAAEKDLVGAT